MAQISKPHTFVDAASMIAGEWNANYDTLYNEVNGNLDNSNVKSGAAITENKFVMDGNYGHKHSGGANGEAINIATLSSSGVHESDIAWFNGSSWALLGTGENNTVLKIGHDSYTKLLLHCDGADASTAFVDDMGKTVTNTTSAQNDTAQFKYGTASALFNGSSDYITVADSDDFNFGTGNFTIDFWVRWYNFTGNQGLVSQYEDDDNYWRIGWNAIGTYIELLFRDGGTTMGSYRFNPDALGIADVWTHLAFVRNGTTALIFKNGVSQTLTTNTAFGSNDVGNITGDLIIGAYITGTTTYRYYNGWIDEVRVSKGIARWTSNFTPYEHKPNLVWATR